MSSSEVHHLGVDGGSVIIVDPYAANSPYVDQSYLKQECRPSTLSYYMDIINENKHKYMKIYKEYC